VKRINNQSTKKTQQETAHWERKYVTKAEEKALWIICGESFVEDRMNCVSPVFGLGPLKLCTVGRTAHVTTVYVLLELLLILKD